MIDKYTAQATTEQEAVEKGLKELGIKREEAEIEVNTESKKGFLGIGQRDAVVTIIRKKQTSLEEMVRATEPSLDSAFDLNDNEETNTEEAEIKIQEEASAPIPSKQTSEESEEIEEVDEESLKPEANSFLNSTDERAIGQVKDYLEDILSHMGVEDAKVIVTQNEERVRYDIETEDAGLVIGRHGKVLNGLQTLIQIQIHQLADKKLYAKVDAENYRSRRRDTVQQLAKKTADKVKKTKQPVILEPMPANERKQIHHYLHKVPGIETHSEGKEPHRYLVVELAE